MPSVPYQRDSRAIVTLPINLASSKKGTAAAYFVSLLFSLLYLDRPSMGAEVGRFERFVFLF